MALSEQVILDISSAQRQIDALEAQLQTLSQPVRVPVDIQGEQAADTLRRELSQADDAVESLNQELAQTDRELDQVEDSARRTGRELDDAGRKGVSSFKGLAASVTGFAGALVAFQGVQALGRGISAAIQDASDLEESISKTNVVFEDFSDTIQSVAQNAPRALGLSTQAALEATATFGNLFTALGLTRGAAAELSPDIVQLAADLASFNNISVEEAILALRSGLVGEVEPLRRLGVAINAAVVESKALELGLVDANGAVTEAGKVQARYALILEQTTNAQGDYARTADGIANTQRTLGAEFQNISAAVGEALLPAYQALLDIAPALVDGLDNLIPVIAGISQSMADAVPSAQSFGDVLQFFGEIPAAVGNLASLTGGVLDLASAFPRALFSGEAVFTNLESGFQTISDVIDDIDFGRLKDGLVDALQAGVDPARALGDALVELTTLDFQGAELSAAAQALIAISGVDPSRAKDLADALRDQGAAAGVETEELGLLLSALNKVFEVQNRNTGRRGRGSAPLLEEAEAIAQVEDAILSEADALAILDSVAGPAGQTIAGLLDSQKELPPELQAAADALAASTLQYLRQVDAIDALDVATGGLPGTIAAARDAMQTTEGEIVGDFETFLENLRTTVAEQQEFDLGLALLRTLGLDDLAAQFEAAGVEALELVNDALANPAKAQEAERLIDGQYVGVGTSIKDDILAGLEGQEINTALIQSLIAAAEQANTPEVRQAFLQLAEELGAGLVVEATVVPVFSPEAARAANDASRFGGGDLTPQAVVNLEINNPTTQDLNTDAARAAQTISSVVRVRSGAQ